MKTITVTGASRYSRGSGRNRKDFAQVTFLTGEGSARRSGTAHPMFKPGQGYVGFNPDPRAIPLNQRREAELATAKTNLRAAETALANLLEELEKVEDTEAGTPIQGMIVEVVKLEITDAIPAAELAVKTAEAAVTDAKEKLAIVQREHPLEVAFVGPGLTY